MQPDDNNRRIVIDTREQRPYDIIGSIRQKLPAGDYSIEGYESRIAIERKSLNDWIGTILNSRVRFHREVAKLMSYDFAAIVIEAAPADITAHNYKSEIKPDALLGIVTDLMVRWKPIQIVLAGDRPHARIITEKLLRFAQRQIENREEVEFGGSNCREHRDCASGLAA